MNLTGHDAPASAYGWGDYEAVKQAVDPSAAIPGMPPNMGEIMLPHVTTFQGILSSVSRVYRPSDEAIKDSFDNARFMLNDLVVTECIDQRRRSVCLLNWHLEPEDEGDPKQKQLCADLTAILARIPNFMKYREALSYAIWYGRYGCQQRYRWKFIKGQPRVAIDRWLPINGDKLVFRYDDGRREFNPDQIGIRVGAGYTNSKSVDRQWDTSRLNQVQPTDYGLAYFLNDWERSLISVHKYLIEDGEYEDPMNAGRIQGLGIRSRIYWVWYQKQETLAWLTEYLERSALGMEIWYYPWGNEQARAQTMKAAQERIGQGRNIVLVPKPMGEQDAYGVQRIEPGMAGAEVIRDIVEKYFGHLIKRYVLGQTMTTEAVPGSLGSGQGDIHLDTYMQIVRYDATNLEETLTTDLVEPLKMFNAPWANNIHIAFKIDTEAPDVEKKLTAWKDAYEMGMGIKEQDLMDLTGMSKPEPGDAVLRSPEALEGRQIEPDPTAGGPSPAQPADFKGKSQVSLMGQDFIELMRILQNKQDAKQLEAELGGEETEPQRAQSTQRTAKYARPKKPAAGQGDLLGGQPRDADGEFASRRGGATVADDFELTGKPRSKKPVGENHDKNRQTKLLDGMDALPGQKDLFSADSHQSIERQTYTTFKHPEEGHIDLRRIALHGPPRQAQHELVETYKEERHVTPARDEAHGRAMLAKRIAQLTDSGWRRNEQERYAAGDDERWITIGGHRGSDGKKHGGTPVKISGGKIVSGPQALTGKTLKGLAKRKPHLELKLAIHKAHKEHGFDKRHIADAIELVHGERKRLHDEREAAKEQARKLTGLTAADISRLSNAGHDYSSGLKAGGVTGDKLAHFDEFAQELARSHPELGLGDPDSHDNFSQRLWDVLGEGKLAAPAKHHEDTIQEAIDLLHANAKYLNQPEEEAIPFAADPEDGERHRLAVPDRPPVAVGSDGADLMGMLSAAFAERGY